MNCFVEKCGEISGKNSAGVSGRYCEEIHKKYGGIFIKNTWRFLKQIFGFLLMLFTKGLYTAMSEAFHGTFSKRVQDEVFARIFSIFFDEI